MDNDKDPTRPSIGFPLGLALLLVMLFCMSTVFSCCLHWNKLRSLLQSSPGASADIEADIKPAPPVKISKQPDTRSLSVLMPGDQVPKFLAMACPYQPPLHGKGLV